MFLKLNWLCLFDLQKYEADEKIEMNALEFNLISLFLQSLLLPGNNSTVFSAGMYAYFFNLTLSKRTKQQTRTFTYNYYFYYSSVGVATGWKAGVRFPAEAIEFCLPHSV
jgi:hypothetical protein